MRRLVFAAMLLAPLGATAQTPVAAPGQPGWTPAGKECFVWNQNPAKDETAEWTGPCEQQHATGKGVLVWRLGNVQQRYDGEMRDGRLNGRGIYSFGDGGRYEGQFKDDQFDGIGTLIDGSNRYDGGWKAGKKDGHGVMIMSDGNRYDGDFKEDVLEGKGVFTLVDGRRFEGQLARGWPNGQGTLVDQDGTYTGTWVDGCFNDGKRKAAFAVDPAGCK